MKRIPVCFLVVFASPITASADYVRTSFADLAGTSAAIVVGTIAEVDEDTFLLSVEDVLAGPTKKGEKLKVRRFQDWVCAWRWADYEVGQKLLVFLNRAKEEPVWISRGAACEGESPIVENEVHANFDLPGQTVEYQGRLGGKCYLTAVPLHGVRTAILDFRAAFRVVPAKDPWHKDDDAFIHIPFERIKSVDNPTESKFRPRRKPPEFRTRSSLHRHLADIVQTERKRIRKYDDK